MWADDGQTLFCACVCVPDKTGPEKRITISHKLTSVLPLCPTWIRQDGWSESRKEQLPWKTPFSVSASSLNQIWDKDEKNKNKTKLDLYFFFFCVLASEVARSHDVTCSSSVNVGFSAASSFLDLWATSWVLAHSKSHQFASRSSCFLNILLLIFINTNTLIEQISHNNNPLRLHA